MLVGLIVLGLYGWSMVSSAGVLSHNLLVGSSAAILAVVTIVVSLVLYFWAPQEHIFTVSYSVFGLLVVLTATLLVETGMTNSPFVALWMLVSVFAAVFGTYGIVPLFILLLALAGQGYIASSLDSQMLITLLLGGVIPLGIGYILWHSQSTTKDTEKSAYNDLATELSQVAGKSEVVINAIADGVIALDAKGVIELINPAAQNLIGWGKQDAIGLDYKSVLKLIDKKDTELTAANDPIVRVLTDNTALNTKDFGLVTSSGKHLLLSLVVSPVGQIGAGVIVVFRDITKELSDERQEAEFISTASHEMRTPVASIEGYLGLALNPHTAQIDDKARDFITKAHQSAEHLGRLFQDLLDVTKADDGRLSNNPKVTDVVNFTHEVVQGLTPKAHEKNLRITYKPLPDEGIDGGDRVVSPIFYALVDNDHLHEVLANLVENAIKYTLTGDVVVDVTGSDDKVIVSIQDSGIGIPAEDQSHLFQKFYRVDNRDTREIGGTGLGLYLCRRLVEVMNGRIWLESEYQKGSTFFVAIPRLASDEATRLIEQAAEKPLPAPVKTPTILAEPMQTPLVVAPQIQVRPITPSSVQPIAAQPPSAPSTPPASLQIPSQATNVTATNRPNTPITSIEQNTAQYIGQHRNLGLTVPARRRDE